MKEVYSGINLQAHNQRVPYGEIDAHAIAIAVANAPPNLDHSWDLMMGMNMVARMKEEQDCYWKGPKKEP
eukprot:6568931-Ditylum_brightwellii.AAC.1